MRPLITGNTIGHLYILCFDQVIGNVANAHGMARHYLGWALDLAGRLATHKAGRGQPLTAEAVRLGIGWQVFYRVGTPELERYLKGHYKRTPHLCPRCCPKRRKPAYGFQPLDQLALPLTSAPVEAWPEGFDFPAPALARPTWAEIQHDRAQRAAGVVLVGTDDWDDGLL